MQSAEEFLLALDPEERGRVISVMRSARGLSRDKLAKVANVSPNTISDWERGGVTHPRSMYPKLHPVLNMSLSNLRHASKIVRNPPPKSAASEVSEGAGEYEPAESGKVDASEFSEMTPPQITEHILELYSEIGRLETQIRLLQTELAVRHGILRPRG